jgi:protein-disulfide isomerase
MDEKQKKYIILSLIILAETSFILYFIFGPNLKTNRLSKPARLAQEAIDFINQNLNVPQPLTLVEPVEEKNGLLVFQAMMGTTTLPYPIFMTKDGEYLFLEVIPLKEIKKRLAQIPKKDISSVNLSNRPTLGPNNAPVKIVEFLDFTCPHCKNFSLNILPKIKKDYVSTGLVQIIFKNFPLNVYSQKLALAGQCAFEQNKFWEFYDFIFTKENKMTDEEIKNVAKNLNLNVQQFSECFDSQKYLKEIEEDLQDGISVGVNGTPSFFINKKALKGGQNYEQFKNAIDSEVQKALTLQNQY